MDWEPLIVTQVVQIAALAGFVWLITACCTRRHAHLTQALWLVVLLKCLTPPVWTSPLSVFARWESATAVIQSTGRFDGADTTESPCSDVPMASPTAIPDHAIPPYIPRSPYTPVQVSPLELPIAAPPDNLASLQGPPTNASAAFPASLRVPELTPALALEPANADYRSPSNPSSRAVATLPARHAASAGGAGWSAWRSFMTVWLLGVMTMLTATFGRAWWFARRLQRHQVEVMPEVAELLQQLRQSTGVRQRVRLLVTESAVGPAVLGLVRPTIVLPQFLLDNHTIDELRPLLAHELIHVRRGDLWVSLLRHLAQACWWFHPLVWKTASSLRLGAERCCDEEVIARLQISAAEYARSLVRVLELKQQLRAVPVAPGVRPFDITSTRLEKIMRLGQGSRSATPAWCWAMAAVLAAVSLPGARLVSQQPTDVTPATADDQNHAVDSPLAPPNQPQIRTPYPPSTTPENQLKMAASAYAFAGNTAAPAGPRTEPAVQLQCQTMIAGPDSIGKLKIRWRTLAVNRAPTSRPLTLKPGDTQTWAQSRQATQKRFPVLYALLTDAEAQKLRARTKDLDVDVLSRPTLTTRDGGHAACQIGASKPFVVGISEDGKPEAEVVPLGLEIELLPRIVAKDIRLRFRVTETELLSVDSLTVPSEIGNVELQIPELQRSWLDGLSQIPAGQTLLLRLQPRADEGTLLAMFKPTILAAEVTPGTDAKKKAPATISATGSAATMVNNAQKGTHSKDKLVGQAGEASPAVRTKPRQIDWARLQRRPPEEHRIQPEDVLGVYIVGVLGSEDQFPPVQLPNAENVPPALGFPIPVRADGTIPLPLIDDPKVVGLTIEEAEAKIRRAYTTENEFLHKDQSCILTLIRPRHIRCLVFRHDFPTTVSFDDGGWRFVGLPRGAFSLDLPADEADVLTALARTGGLTPDPTKHYQAVIYHQKTPGTATRIPLTHSGGKEPIFEESDIILHDGDVLIIAEVDAAETVTVASNAATSAPMPAVSPTKQQSASPVQQAKSEDKYRPVTLDECVSIAMSNDQTLRTLGLKKLSLMPGSDTVVYASKVPTVLVPRGGKRGSEAEIAQLRKRVQDYVNEISLAYWKLYFCHRNLDAARTGASAALKTWKALPKADGSEDSDATNEAQARAQYFSFKSRAKTGEINVSNAESRLRYLLGEAQVGKRLKPIDAPSRAKISYERGQIVNEALSATPDLGVQQQRVADASRLLANCWREAWGQSTEQEARGLPANSGTMNRDELRKSLTAEQSDQLQALEAAYHRELEQLGRIHLAVRHKVEDALERLESSYRIGQTQFNTLVAYRDQTEAAENAYCVAQTFPLDLVLDAQSRTAQAESDYFHALTEYQKSVLSVEALRGNLLNTMGIQIGVARPAMPAAIDLCRPL